MYHSKSNNQFLILHFTKWCSFYIKASLIISDMWKILGTASPKEEQYQNKVSLLCQTSWYGVRSPQSWQLQSYSKAGNWIYGEGTLTSKC